MIPQERTDTTPKTLVSAGCVLHEPAAALILRGPRLISAI